VRVGFEVVEPAEVARRRGCRDGILERELSGRFVHETESVEGQHDPVPGAEIERGQFVAEQRHSFAREEPHDSSKRAIACGSALMPSTSCGWRGCASQLTPCSLRDNNS
jgi:hypothetical protein